MTQLIYIGGSHRTVGKTFIARGIITALRDKTIVGAWKPVDTGHIIYNANDVSTDAELLYHASRMTEHQNLVNPYMLNENYPPVLAAQRDGVEIKMDVLENYRKMLQERYPILITEGLSGLCLPITKTHTELDVIRQWATSILWITDIGESSLAETLAQLKIMKHEELPVKGIILNNWNNCDHADLLHYQWLTLEQQTSLRVWGMIPRMTEPAQDENIANWIQSYLEKGILNTLIK
ncbi:MAG: dethiobiotin synthase [SAR324 cluster bacterium]|nr:dethiobiotin synthase [SAR324 cluster bacterium]